jgi:hypothetical protein
MFAVHRDDGSGRPQDGSLSKGCTARHCSSGVAAQAEAGWSVQSRNRLGVCLADDERQATSLARGPLATIRATSSEGGEDREAGWFHTFRHTYTTLLTQNNEEVKVVQELLRHANSRITLDLYAQAGMPNKRLAQSKLVRLVLNKGEAHGPNWTKLEPDQNCQFLGNA